MVLLLLLLVPIAVGIGGFFLGKKRITPREAVGQIAIVGVLIVGGYYLTRWAGIQDTELWNGRIASKPSGSEHCCHSYECNCRTVCSGAGKDRKCDRKCDTCYRHSSDYWFKAITDNNETVYDDDCETSTPSFWTKIQIGDPTVVEHRFTNYVLADPGAIIPEAKRTEFEAKLPAYPKIFAGWKARRLIFAGLTHERADVLDWKLSEINADLGKKKQVNMIVVVVREADPQYFDALRAAWLGGKKNDVVLVIGVPEYPAIAWTRVMAWNRATGSEDAFRGGLEARILALNTFDGDAVLDGFAHEVERAYERRAFSELDYLMARAKPPVWALIVMVVVGLLASGGLQHRFWHNRSTMYGPPPHERVIAWWKRLRAPRV